MNQTFGVGSVLGMSFRVYGRNIVPFTLIAAVVYAPLILWTISLTSGSFSPEAAAHYRYAGALQFPLNAFMTATLTYGVVKELQGQRASIGSCLATGFARMFPAIGVALLQALAILGGMMLLIIPGIIAACTLYVAMPASVIEKPGIIGALKRSAELTRGYRGAIFGMFLIMIGGGIVIAMVEQSAFVHGVEGFRTFLLANCITTIILGALSSVIAAVAYFQLRADKDGTTAHDLAKVFE
jgi:hypothetical protein